MTDNQRESEGRRGSETEPPTSNHVIWGMTLGIAVGTALGFIVFDSVGVGVGVAIGIVLGFVLSMGFYRAMK